MEIVRVDDDDLALTGNDHIRVEETPSGGFEISGWLAEPGAEVFAPDTRFATVAASLEAGKSWGETHGVATLYVSYPGA